MKLYTYFRSSASFRVRIALNLKQIDYLPQPVHLVRDGGEQWRPEFGEINPQRLVPVLEDGGERLTQSLAIIEYLDETYPEPPLMPVSAIDRARVRGIALAIACDIHPLNNTRVLKYLGQQLGIDEARRNTWYRHWVEQGLQALERRLSTEPQTGRFCHGDTPTMADCALVPQIFNAQRFDCDLRQVPTLMRIHEHCMALDAFARAAPAAQADAE